VIIKKQTLNLTNRYTMMFLCNVNMTCLWRFMQHMPHYMKGKHEYLDREVTCLDVEVSVSLTGFLT